MSSIYDCHVEFGTGFFHHGRFISLIYFTPMKCVSSSLSISPSLSLSLTLTRTHSASASETRGLGRGRRRRREEAFAAHAGQKVSGPMASSPLTLFPTIAACSPASVDNH